MRRRSGLLIAALAALSLAMAPALAAAAAGGGGSFGSRGSRTFSAPPSTRTAPYQAAPMQRSLTPSAPAPGYAAPPAGFGQSGFGGRSSFMSGLFGGLLGAGIGGLLFGNGLFGGGGLGFAGFFGFLLQVFLIVLLVRFLIGLFRRSQPATAGGPSLFARGDRFPRPAAGYGGSGVGPQPSARSVTIDAADYQTFERILREVQAAWSAQDVNALRGLLTPEMLSYFAEQLTTQASQGVRNVVGSVRLEQGDLAEAWAENGQEFATVAMRFSLTDVTVDASGRVVDGSADEHVTRTEVWTFVRAPGGRWLLSAIQQAR